MKTNPKEYFELSRQRTQIACVVLNFHYQIIDNSTVIIIKVGNNFLPPNKIKHFLRLKFQVNSIQFRVHSIYSDFPNCSTNKLIKFLLAIKTFGYCLKLHTWIKNYNKDTYFERLLCRYIIFIYFLL